MPEKRRKTYAYNVTSSSLLHEANGIETLCVGQLEDSSYVAFSRQNFFSYIIFLHVNTWTWFFKSLRNAGLVELNSSLLFNFLKANQQNALFCYN